MSDRIGMIAESFGAGVAEGKVWTSANVPMRLNRGRAVDLLFVPLAEENLTWRDCYPEFAARLWSPEKQAQMRTCARWLAWADEV